MEPAVIVPLLAQALDPNDAVSEAHLTEWAEHLAVTAQQPPEPHGWRWRWQRVSLPDGEGEALAIAQPDRPLLFATALIAFDRAGIRPRFTFHPVVTAADGQPESWMLFICEPLPKAARATLEAALTEGFLQAVAASDDWPLMRERANVTASLLPRWCGTQSDPTWVRECQALLEWVASGHFVLLGCRDYQVERNSDSVQLRRIPDSGLGVLRDSSARSEYSESFARLPAPARDRPPLRLPQRNPGLGTRRQRNRGARTALPGVVDRNRVPLPRRATPAAAPQSGSGTTGGRRATRQPPGACACAGARPLPTRRGVPSGRHHLERPCPGDPPRAGAAPDSSDHAPRHLRSLRLGATDHAARRVRHRNPPGNPKPPRKSVRRAKHRR
ncbi:MAG TPA: hypothetical protein DIT50_02875 [Rhodocyclaceae bacterium]|nr:hypothetical protein [Rhodocyclaceae bacterium]